MIERLERQDEFDVTVIGAGATGLGVALDAASRGMSVLIVDGQDWASGHASRSGKHIGSDIRRLVCPAGWARVREELYERRLLLQNAPSLVRAQNYVIPCRSKVGMELLVSRSTASFRAADVVRVPSPCRVVSERSACCPVLNARDWQVP